MRTFFNIIFILSFVFAAAQMEYTDIPRTHLSMKVPEDFISSEPLIIYSKNEFEKIYLMEQNPGNYYKSFSTFTKDYFQNKGVVVYEFGDTLIAGFEAKYIISNADIPGYTIISIGFGDSTFSVSGISIFKDNEELKNELLNNLLNIKYNDNKDIDLFEKCHFKFDTSNATFQFLNYAAGVYLFSMRDNINSKHLIMVSPYKKTEAADLEYFTANAVKKSEEIRSTNPQITKSEKTVIEGISYYQITGEMYIESNKFYFFSFAQKKENIIISTFGFCPYESENKEKMIDFINSVKIN